MTVARVAAQAAIPNWKTFVVFKGKEVGDL
jgi:hypothetical protein